MAKFSNIVRGTRALRPVEFSIWGEAASCSVRPMTGAEEGDAVAAGRAYAVKHGVVDPKPTDRVYEIGVMANTLLVACVDSDDSNSRYFANVGEILDNLDTDRIAYLYEAQQFWQDECSPLAKSMTAAEFAAKVVEIEEAAEGVDFFMHTRPAMRCSFARHLVAQLFSALRANSGSSTPSEAEPTNSAPPQSDNH